MNYHNFKKTIILSIVTILFLFHVTFSEISFGAYQYEKYINIKANELKITKILVWSSNNKDFKLTLEVVEKPKSMEIFIDKKEVIVSNNLTNYFEIISLNGNVYKAIPINIFLYSYENLKNERVTIRSIAEDLTEKNIKIKFEKDFTFLINFEKVEEKKDTNEIFNKENTTEKFDWKSIIPSFNFWERILPILILAISVLISFIIIKRRS
ncbi:MAG: hypothetical protein QW197_01330 [Candidatus Aenigmatarchaeota archaeon]